MAEPKNPVAPVINVVIYIKKEEVMGVDKIAVEFLFPFPIAIIVKSSMGIDSTKALAYWQQR